MPAVFGVSGYSGAGTTPGPRNDPDRLRDNLMPYKLVGHNHEKETVRHLGIPGPVHPPCPPGIPGSPRHRAHPAGPADDARPRSGRSYEEQYGEEPLIEIRDAIPELRDGADHAGVIVGGFETSADGQNAVVVAAEDNLLKGAAVQAIQNVNLALGLDEFDGLGPIGDH